MRWPRGFARSTIDIDLLTTDPRVLDLLKLTAGGALDLRDAAALLAAGDRNVLIVEVEARLPDVRPDASEVWRQVLAIEA